MKTARLGIGILLLTGLAAGLGQAFVPETGARRFGLIEGTVTYHGRPVTAGRIIFVEEGHPLAEGLPATIGTDGRYQCADIWLADRSTPRRYRILVDQLEPKSPAPAPVAVETAGHGERGKSATPTGQPDDRGRRATQAILATMKRPQRVDPSRPAPRPPRHRFSDLATTDLAVWLDAEAAHVNVALED